MSCLCCKEMCKWWYWMEDCNIARASPASTDTSSDTTVWHDTILHTVTNLWGPAQLRGGDTTHQHTEHANFTEPIPMRCSHSNLQFWVDLPSLNWSRVCDLSTEEECLWLVWCLDLSGFSVPALSARQIGEGSPGPGHQIDSSSHQNIIWQTWYFRGFLQQFVTDHFTLPARSSQLRSGVKYQN